MASLRAVGHRRRRLDRPEDGLLRYGEWAAQWMRGLDVKPKTRHGYESLLRSRILPAFGHVKLSAITSAMVRKWVVALTAKGLSASRVKQARAILRQSLEVARLDGLIGTNPARGVKAPVTRRREPRYLTAEQVARLVQIAEARQDGAGALVWVPGGYRAAGVRRWRCGVPPST